MEMTKILQVLAKYIISIEEDNSLKDWEIKKLKEELKSCGGNKNE